MVRWTKLGDKSTKFFHTTTTKRYKINTITSLGTEDGRIVTSHPEKVALLWGNSKRGWEIQFR
jgi:hypothetical protein